MQTRSAETMTTLVHRTKPFLTWSTKQIMHS